VCSTSIETRIARIKTNFHNLTIDIILLCVAAFLAGFTDAISGGGGLIQTPAALILLPQYPAVTVIGSLKLPAASGTFIAAIQYARKIKMNAVMVGVLVAIAFCAAFAGSTLLSKVSNDFIKPFLLVVLTGVAIYTYSNKKFGEHTEKDHNPKQQWGRAILISLVLGFYDGFIGPGAGSFMMLCFITLLGFDFLKASAHTKMVNLASNLGSLVFFIISGKILYQVALPMAACNALGGLLGARLAILKGNAFIRIFFLAVVVIVIVRFAYDVFK
jgi:uncharacterized membrane protein YfcA